jgi:4-hydroxy-3-methylbut-2-enyl diphosphate reductase
LDTENFLPEKPQVTVLVTSGASCPDAMVEGLIVKLAACFGIDNIEGNVTITPGLD